MTMHCLSIRVQQRVASLYDGSELWYSLCRHQCWRVSEIIDNGNNGLLHGDDLDPNAVARSIEALSTERLISMGKNAKNPGKSF